MPAVSEIVAATARSLQLVDGEVRLPPSGGAQIHSALRQLGGEKLVHAAKTLVQFAGELRKEGWQEAAQSILSATARSTGRIEAYLASSGLHPGLADAKQFATWSGTTPCGGETEQTRFPDRPVHSLLSLLANK